MRIAYKLFYRLFRATAYVPVPLDAGDFSLLDRRVVDALNELPETDRFMRGLRAWVGFRQTGVPYVRPERTYGTSTNSLVAQPRLGAARSPLVFVRAARPDRVAGVRHRRRSRSSRALVQIVLRFVDPSLAPRGFTSLLVVILFLGGIQLLCLAIIGSYLAHIYDEVKRRPPYIVESVLNAPTSATADHEVEPDAMPPSRTSRRNAGRAQDAARRVTGGRT